MGHFPNATKFSSILKKKLLANNYTKDPTLRGVWLWALGFTVLGFGSTLRLYLVWALSPIKLTALLRFAMQKFAQEHQQLCVLGQQAAFYTSYNGSWLLIIAKVQTSNYI